jgi:hypothetical protein
MRAARSRLKSPTGNRGKKTAKRRPTAGDPFDPDEFNRQTGPAAREPRQSSPTREQNR